MERDAQEEHTQAIFRSNEERQKYHAGETFYCSRCGEAGVVGETLVAAFREVRSSIPPSYTYGYYWMHTACLPPPTASEESALKGYLVNSAILPGANHFKEWYERIRATVEGEAD